MKLTIDLTKQYGILLSGGLDSSILLYLLIKQEPNIRIQPFTIPKFDGSAIYVDPIIEYINQKFDTDIPGAILVGDPTAYHRLQSTTAVIEIFSNYKIDFLFNGINQNPPELLNYPGAPDRDKRSIHPKIICPFIDLYKDDIIKMNPDTELMKLSHTCTEQKVGRCNVCWQCTERKWAFSKLGIVDPGKA